MKIGIFTQPLHTNYGGILQNYALQTVLKRMGHEPWTIRKKDSVYRYCRSKVSRFVKDKILHKDNIPPTQAEYNIIAKNLNEFVEKNINTTEKINLYKKKGELEKYDFDAFIVGSDQVWRPRYNRNILNNYLDFLDENSKTKKIAYAASFGVDKWEYSHELTTQCRGLAQSFDTISVREESAIDLCKKNLHVEAKQVLDPTLLLDENDYLSLSNQRFRPKKKTLAAYVLDVSTEKQKIVNDISKKFGLETITIMPTRKYTRKNKNYINECIYCPVSAFIETIYQSDYVVTDSYHGTIFSIIFNKPFISISNERRGISRFNALLGMFSLKNRLISIDDHIQNIEDKNPIDYKSINQKIHLEKKKSLSYIVNNFKH